MVKMDGIAQELSQVSLSKEGVSSTNAPPSKLTDSSVDHALTSYLLPVHKKYMKKLNPDVNLQDQQNFEYFQVSNVVGQNLYSFIWGPDVFKSPLPHLRGIYDSIAPKLSVSPEQSDLQDFLQYHPMEVVSSKFIQLILAIAMIEPRLVDDNLKYLKDLLECDRIMMESSSLDAYEFLLTTSKHLYHILTAGPAGVTSPDPTKLGDLGNGQLFNDLTKESKGIIKGLSSLYMKAFRAKPKERFDKMNNARHALPGNVELGLYTAEMLRMKRRESTMKRPTAEEMSVVEETLKMERSNPFVRLNLIDCIVDGLREANGRFHCGDIIHLHDTQQAMKFMQDECIKLCEDFPKNVHFLSVVADYFARYVPLLYFDKEYSKNLLMGAYHLNPKNPKTTHRLGILHRMNMRNIPESLKWLEETLELDPTHYHANIDYFKTILGKPKVYKNMGQKMEERLNSPITSAWRKFDKCDFQFYAGLAYFASGQKEDTIRHWIEAMKTDESNFNLSEVDSSCSFFCWDSTCISTDMIREWIYSEVQQIKKIKEAGGEYDSNKQKSIERMFHLMLGIVSPKREDMVSGPYTMNFECSLVA